MLPGKSRTHECSHGSGNLGASDFTVINGKVDASGTVTTMRRTELLEIVESDSTAAGPAVVAVAIAAAIGGVVVVDLLSWREQSPSFVSLSAPVMIPLAVVVSCSAAEPVSPGTLPSGRPGRRMKTKPLPQAVIPAAVSSL